MLTEELAAKLCRPPAQKTQPIEAIEDSGESTDGFPVNRNREEPLAKSSWHACERCGAAATVHRLTGYETQRAIIRRFCESCADTVVPPESFSLRLGIRPRLSTVLMAAGVIFILLGCLADVVMPIRSVGFGIRQQIGVIAGTPLFCFGVLLRSRVVSLVGAMLIVACITADSFGLGRSDGWGWKQSCFIFVGLGAVAVGLTGRWRHRLRDLIKAARLTPASLDTAPASADPPICIFPKP